MMVKTVPKFGPSILAMVFAVAALAVAGCGSGDELDRREVRGAATYANQPIAEGTITLFPKGDGPVASGAIVEGKYLISRDQGPIPGEYRVEITGLKKTGKMLRIDEPGRPPQEIPEVRSYLPHKYNTNSELTLSVSSEESVVEHDFLLEE